MNINTVRDNLKNTIANKEQLLATMVERKSVKRELVDQVAFMATMNFLEVNIDELKAILADVEKCAAGD